jgi:alpha-beta hydrolase superfamily lysophospholipase
MFMRVPAVVFFDGLGVHIERQEHCCRTKQGHEVLSNLRAMGFDAFRLHARG